MVEKLSLLIRVFFKHLRTHDELNAV